MEHKFIKQPGMQHNPIIRSYAAADRAAVLNLLKLNIPAYFSPEEEKDLIHYLDHEIEFYFVMELDRKIVGCGGFNFSGDETHGKIAWDFFHPDYQGKSLGTQLLTYRLDKLNEFKNLKKISVRTSQKAYLFYEKAGFRLAEVVKDYWAKGFDLYRMEL